MSESIPNTWSFSIFKCCTFILQKIKITWNLISTQNQISNSYISTLHACCINNNNKIERCLFVHAWNAEEAVPKTKFDGKQLRLRSENSRRWRSEEGSKALIWVTMVMVIIEKMKSNENTLKSNAAILIMFMHKVKLNGM